MIILTYKQLLCLQNVVTNVTQILKTVKTVEDESSRGTRAIEAAIEAIGQEIESFNSSEPSKSTATPEDLMIANRAITQATSKAVSASNSGDQDDIIAVANLGRKFISELLTTCKVFIHLYHLPFKKCITNRLQLMLLKMLRPKMKLYKMDMNWHPSFKTCLIKL